MILADLILPLAQADAPPADFGPWLANAMYVILSAAGIMGGLAAWKSYKTKEVETPQPLMVQQHAEFVQKPDFDKAMREAHGRIARERIEVNAGIAKIEAAQVTANLRLDAELNALREQLAQNNADGEARAAKLHDRINVMLENTSELRGEVRSALARRH